MSCKSVTGFVWCQIPAPIRTRLGVKATTLKAKAKDLASNATAKAKDGVKANVNMVCLPLTESVLDSAY